ncbi:hypothetical protein [Candidatus Nitrotoga sp. AM1P]|nr:hypothetical protein [Candidatus Nitrotoga sp. AM1P]
MNTPAQSLIPQPVLMARRELILLGRQRVLRAEDMEQVQISSWPINLLKC